MAFAFSVSSNIPVLTQSGTDNGLAGIATAIAAAPTVARSTAYTTASPPVKPPTGTGMWYRCSTAGTTAAAAPTYTTTSGTTTTDGTAQFTAFLAPDVRTLGTQNLYYMPEVRVNVTGTLTNPNPQIASFVCWDLLLPTAGCSFTSGTWASDGVTPLYDGFHFVGTRVSSNPSDNASGSLQVQFGTLTLIGGEVQVAGAIGNNAGSTINTYYTRWRGTKQWGGVTSTRIRSYSNTSIWRQCELFDIAFDRFDSPAEFSTKARKSEYLIQYVGSTNGGVNSKFTASNVENLDGSYDFDNYGCGWCELYNSAKGASLNVTTQQPTTAIKQTFFVPLFQNVSITGKTTAGVAVQDVRFSCTDVPNNSPATTITTYDGLKTWDYRAALTYQTTTNSSGVASSTPALQAWYYGSGAIQKNLRFPAGTAVYEGRAYNYKTLFVNAVLGSNSAVQVPAGMVALDTPTTIALEATALAQTGIVLTPTGATGGTILISSNHTLNDLWDYYRAWISQFSNRPSNDTWTCTGGVLATGAWTLQLAPGVVLSTGATITSITSSSVAVLGSLFDSDSVWTADGVWTASMVWGAKETYTQIPFSNISIVGNVSINTPVNLAGVKITGNLTFNTKSNSTINLTGCIITGTVSNAGAGTVTLTNSGSTIGTIGTNVVTRLRGLLTINSMTSGSTVYIEDSTGTQKDLVTNSGTSYAYDASGSTGTWTAVVELYGKVRQTWAFDPSLGDFTVAASYAPDFYIVQSSKAAVAAYTSIANMDQLYDYAAYMRTLQPQYNLAVKTATNVDFGSVPILFDSAAAGVWSYTGSTLTIKATSLLEGGLYLGFTTTGTVTLAGTAAVKAVYSSNLGTSGVVTINSVAGATVKVTNSGTVLSTTNSTGTDVVYTPPGSSGTWSVLVERYGYVQQTPTFAPAAGGKITVDATAFVQDTFISQATKATVAAYTTISTLDQLYDYDAYYRTLNPGSTIVSRSGSVISVSNSIIWDKTAASVFSYASTTLTVKSASIIESGTKITQVNTSGAQSFLNGTVMHALYTTNGGSSANVTFTGV